MLSRSMMASTALLLACGSESGTGATTPVDAGDELDTSTYEAAVDTAVSDASSSNLRIVVLADLNGSYGSTTYGAPVHAAVEATVSSIRPDIVLLAGDLVAGQKSGVDYAAMWAAFHEAVTNPLVDAGIPVAVTPGNHDASAYAGYAEERAEFVAQWQARLPDVDFIDSSEYPLRYSFSHLGALFVSLDATRVGALSSEQRNWLEGQLAGSEHDVKVVFGHVPIHPVAENVASEVLADDDLESLMADHGVTVFISGHHHAYYPGVAGGVRQVAVGCLGAGPQRLIGADTVSPRSLLRLDVEHGEIVAVEALTGDGFDEPVDRGTLPERIEWGEHLLVRDDQPF